jgi:hypothetical protein
VQHLSLRGAVSGETAAGRSRLGEAAQDLGLFDELTY